MCDIALFQAKKVTLASVDCVGQRVAQEDHHLEGKRVKVETQAYPDEMAMQALKVADLILSWKLVSE